jgi:hypothetical protein
MSFHNYTTNPLRRITRALTQNQNPSPNTSNTLSQDTQSEQQTSRFDTSEEQSSTASDSEEDPSRDQSESLNSEEDSSRDQSDSPYNLSRENNNLISSTEFDPLIWTIDNVVMPEETNLANLPKLTERMDWFTWYPSIKTFAESIDVWSYVDPKGDTTAENPSPPKLIPGREEAYRTAAAYYNMWQAIRQKISQVRARIEKTTAPGHQFILEGVSDTRECLKRLYTHLAPEERDQVQAVREAFNELCLGPIKGKEEEWIQKWTKVVSRATSLRIENMSEAQICIAFIDASRNSNPAFYQMMKGRTIQTQDMARTRDAITLAVQACFDLLQPHVAEGEL